MISTNSSTINKNVLPIKSNFRADLNFLRALAVIAVVLFHFKIGLFSGGFVGVDVFFVISGFLMTKIIVTGLEKNQFSILKFYLARAKRIIPALSVLCIVLLIIAWFLLLPSEYRLLAKHTAASMGFISNYIYIGEAGYFDPASHEKWLLHTWSLSVEWQFYIIYPLILLTIHRLFGHKALKVVLFICSLGSLAYMIQLGLIHHKSLYYGLFARVWEMMSGGIVYLFPLTFSRKMRSSLFYFGISLIVTSVLAFDSTMLWPSLYSLVPIIGTMMVIYAQHNQSTIVTNSLVKFIGLTSYSIYLWHWPFVVSLTVFSLGFTFVNIVGGIALSLLFGYLSYLFIETKFGKLKGNMLTQYVIIGGLAGVVFAAAVVVFLKNGFAIEIRFAKNILVADQEYINRDPRKAQCLVENKTNSPHCIYGNKNSKVAVILFGDSHASAVVNALAEAMKTKGSVLFIAQAGCMSVKGMHRIGKNNNDCTDFVKNEIAYIKKQYPNVPVLMVNRWSYYLKGKLGKNTPLVYFGNKPDPAQSTQQLFSNHLNSTLCDLSSSNPTFILKSIPEFSAEVPKLVAKKLQKSNFVDVKLTQKSYQQRNGIANSIIDNAAKTCKIKVLDPSDLLCKSDICYGSISGRPLYYDDNHLSEFGNRLLIPLLKKVHSDYK